MTIATKRYALFDTDADRYLAPGFGETTDAGEALAFGTPGDAAAFTRRWACSPAVVVRPVIVRTGRGGCGRWPLQRWVAAAVGRLTAC